MKLERVRSIADAVLYEGYILYPYRSSATKNRSRWSFGGIFPRVWSEATAGAEPGQLASEFLVRGGEGTRIECCLRFLQPLTREVGAIEPPLATWPADGEPAFRAVSLLDIDERHYCSWQEAIEREFQFEPLEVAGLAERPMVLEFTCPAQRSLEPLTDRDGLIRGSLLRRQCAQRGRMRLSAVPVAAGVWRVAACIENDTAMVPAQILRREEANLYSFASTHLVFGIESGAFVSRQDPPEALAESSAACVDRGLFPILAGDPGTHDLLLAAPIILYDHPEVAPESPGQYYDATEVDELLSLTIRALTDAEKREMAAADPRAAALLARTEALSGDDMLRLHGRLRVAPPDTAPRLVVLECGGRRLNVGDRVRLSPRPRGDVLDLVLADKTAVIEAIERDFDDRVHVAVTIDEDPGREWGLERMPGHRFFFAPEEIEPFERRIPA
jgi:hypothetical protein